MHSQILSRVCILRDRDSSVEITSFDGRLDNPSHDNLSKKVISQKTGQEGIEKWLKYPELRQTILVLRAVNHRIRKRIMCLLEKHHTLTVTDIYLMMKLEQSVVSQHLGVLRRAGIVETKKNGKYIYYTLNKSRLNDIAHLIENISSGA